MTRLDRVLLAVSPSWALSRIRSRAAAKALARHYEAAQLGRRTENWPRRGTDADGAAQAALSPLRNVSRDLVRNNGWARNALRTINRNVVGYGITPKLTGLPEEFLSAWAQWSGSMECDSYGRHTFAGLQKLVTKTVVQSGEALVRRRFRRPEDGLAIPLQLQVLEPDHLDTSRTLMAGQQGGEVVEGIEFDAIGRRVAYWLFDRHPGSVVGATPVSRRIAAGEILHVYDAERPGQNRGVPWFAAAIVKAREFDEYEDATVVRHKIAALFAAFVTDPNGDPSAAALGEQKAATDGTLVETLEPGIVKYLLPGQTVEFGSPPVPADGGFTERSLRGIAAALGVTYEDLSGDYSQVNFSSARMSRIAHWGNVYDWQWQMLIPQFCDPAWRWAVDAAAIAGLVKEPEMGSVTWTPQPMPLTEPDREAMANVRMIRSGQKTLSEVIREQGKDPDEHLEEYAEDLKKLDELGIVLDSDARKVTQAGLMQANGESGEGISGPTKPPAKTQLKNGAQAQGS